MDVLVAPFEVVNDALVRQLLLHDEDVLKEVDNALIDVEVVELSNHRLLVLEVLLVEVDEGIAFVNYAADIVKGLCVAAPLQLCQSIIEGLVFAFLPLQLKIHVLYLRIVALELTQDHFLVLSMSELGLDLLKVIDDLWQLVRVGLLAARFVE